MPRTYLDHAATTPLDPEVFEAMRPFFQERFGNASSLHHFGREARAALDESRETIARLIGAQAGEILFVSCGTEADNFALKGVADRLQSSGRNHIITDAAEHHAVLEPCFLLSQRGWDVTYLPVDGTGGVNPDSLRAAIRPETGLVSIMHANNEVGTINPLAEISRIAGDNGILMHSDAVQSFGKIRVNVDELMVDMLSISAHKIYGPKGIGALYLRRGTGIERIIHGGGQERGMRGGTENVPLAVGFAKAALLAHQRMADLQRHLGALKERFCSALNEEHPYLLFNGHPEQSLPNIINISFDSRRVTIDGESLLFNLDLAGIAVSSGSACTSGSLEPSHVLIAMGRDLATAKASIRFSLGQGTSEEDLKRVIHELGGVVKRIGRVSR